MDELDAMVVLDASLPPEQWPCLTLTDVTVTVSKGDEPGFVDALEVAIRGPFRVCGRLAEIPAEYEGTIGIASCLLACSMANACRARRSADPRHRAGDP